MNTIEVDFDVYKQLTIRRATEEVSYNDVIRTLLGFKQGTAATTKSVMASSADDWVTKGVRFPAGTDFKANYKGQLHTARIEGGSLVVNGKRFNSPSAAAVSITGSPVNGWRFWECKLPGKSWQFIESLRR
jgi:predicted CopG family antitoxin